MYNWLVYLHILGALGFVLGHGTTSAVTLLLRSQTDADQVRSWLSLARSNVVLGITWASLLLILISGVWAGFVGGWWGDWWIWLSLALLIIITLVMGFIGRGYFDRINAALGVEPAGEPVSQSELEAVLARSPAVALAVVGLGGIAVITWLMMFKPF